MRSRARLLVVACALGATAGTGSVGCYGLSGQDTSALLRASKLTASAYCKLVDRADGGPEGGVVERFSLDAGAGAGDAGADAGPRPHGDGRAAARALLRAAHAEELAVLARNGAATSTMGGLPLLSLIVDGGSLFEGGAVDAGAPPSATTDIECP
jgi:hypothetical protein